MPDADLAEQLRLAFHRLSGLDLDAEREAALVRKLMAITNAAKHDAAAAARRLEAFLADL